MGYQPSASRVWVLEEGWSVRRTRRQVLRLPTINLRHHGDLVPLADGDVLVSASVGPRGQAVTLWADEQSAANRAGAAEVMAARVVEYWPAPALTMRATGLRLAFPVVQPLPDGKTLMVAARSRGAADHNAAVYDGTGDLVATGTLGDGIEHVRTTSDGDIWVGYFDEGVYGNEPLGAHGLVKFSSALAPSWHYTAPGGIGPIDDCYALNVTDREVWTCYYNSFPVVRIQNGQVTAWHCGKAAHALIVHGETIALVRSYGAEHDWVGVGTLTGDRMRIEREFRLTLPDGSELPERARISGHGGELHVLDDTAWHKLSLDDLRA